MTQQVYAQNEDLDDEDSEGEGSEGEGSEGEGLEGENSGIIMKSGCLQRGDCKLEIYQTLRVREDTGGQNSLEFFVQDLFLGATFFIGTMATIGFIVSGLMMVFGGASESMYENGKKGLRYSIIGILLVILSYTIIRAVQFVAQGNR